MTDIAEAIISVGADGWMHAQVRVIGTTEGDALSLTSMVTERLVRDAEVVYRAVPAADTAINFETRETEHRGFARFSFRVLPR